MINSKQILFYKIFFILIFILIIPNLAFGEKTEIEKNDSLILELNKNIPDTSKIRIYSEIAFYYSTTQAKTGLEFALKGKELAEKNIDKKGLSKCYNSLGACYFSLMDIVMPLTVILFH